MSENQDAVYTLESLQICFIYKPIYYGDLVTNVHYMTSSEHIIAKDLMICDIRSQGSNLIKKKATKF